MLTPWFLCFQILRELNLARLELNLFHIFSLKLDRVVVYSIPPHQRSQACTTQTEERDFPLLGSLICGFPGVSYY